MNAELSDVELIRRSRRGELDAFSQLVTRHQQAVRVCLAVRLDNPHEAEDLAQEVFVTAFERLGEFDLERPFGPWLRGIAFNLFRNHCRKFRPESVGGHEELGVLLDQQVAAQCSAAHESALHGALLECLDRFDGPARDLLRLRYADGLSIRDLAARLKRGCSALTMQLHRLRGLLAACVRGRISSNL